MVNTGVLPVESDLFIRGFAELGIILIMFALGFEEQSGNFVRSLKRTWGIALFGALAPFLTAYFVAEHYWHSPAVSVMCGLAMMATAVSLTMVSLKSEGLQNSPVATGIMTSAVLDDIASLALVAILVPIATGETAATLPGILSVGGKAIAFFAIIVAMGVWVFPHDADDWTSRIPLLGSFGIKQVLSFGEGEHATLTILLMALAVGLLAHHFGFHPAVGAYMAGLILKEEYFHFHHHPKINYYENTKKIVDNVAFSWIGPVFFVDLGTKIVFDWPTMVSVIPHTAAMFFGLFFAQILSAGLAAHYTGHFNRAESVMIGIGMLGRAELAFVVMDIAYVQHSILTTEAFYTLMFTAFWLNVAVPIGITLWKPYLRTEPGG